MKGAYIVADSSKETPDTILIATGSQVEVALEAKEKLAPKGLDARVVSMPCMELFEDQTAEYKESVLPAAVTNRVSVEANLLYSVGAITHQSRLECLHSEHLLLASFSSTTSASHPMRLLQRFANNPCK